MTETVRISGQHFTHQALWRTATRFLQKGLAEQKGSFYPLLAATLFSYLAFESLLNAFLHDVAPDVWADERRFFSQDPYKGTLGKCAYLAQLSSLSLDKSRPPYQTVREVARARDFLAHSRIEEYDAVIPAARLDDLRPYPSQLNLYSSADFASRAVADVEALANSLSQAIRQTFDQTMVGSPGGAFYGVEGAWDASSADEA